MDGENRGKPYEQMDDLGGFPLFWVLYAPRTEMTPCFAWRKRALFGRVFSPSKIEISLGSRDYNSIYRGEISPVTPVTQN